MEWSWTSTEFISNSHCTWLCIWNHMGSTDCKVLGSEEGIKLGNTDENVLVMKL